MFDDRVTTGNQEEGAAALTERLASAVAVTEATPDDAACWAYRGALEAALHRDADAVQSLTRSIDILPTELTVRAARERVLTRMGKFADAAADSEVLFRANPDDAEQGDRWASLLSFARLTDQARAAWRELTQRFPDDAEKWTWSGIAAVAHGLENPTAESEDLAEALVSFDRAIAVDPYHAEAYTGRVQVLTHTGRIDEAVATLHQWLGYLPGDVEGLMTMGRLLGSQGRYAEALPYFEVACRLDPRNADIVAMFGITLCSLERYDDAIKPLRRAVELGRNDTSVWAALALSCGETNHPRWAAQAGRSFHIARLRELATGQDVG